MQSRFRFYAELGVIDDAGTHLAYVGPHHPLLKGVNYRGEEWFSAVMGQGLHISDVFLGFRQMPHFAIAVLVREGLRSWILRATLESDIIENLGRAAWIGKKGDAFIINRDHVLQGAAGPPSQRPPAGPDHRPPGGGPHRHRGLVQQ